MRPWFKPSLMISLVVCIWGCATGGYVPVDHVAELDVAFTDSRWTGTSVPKIGVCALDGGGGMSPPLVVRNIPAGTTDVIVEFSDRTYKPMDDGGHGSIRVTVAGKTEVMIPSVPSETFDLPQGVFVETPHVGVVATSFPLRPGAYTGPCSGGKGFLYEADVKAVSKSADPSQPSRLLGKGSITLGWY